MLLLIFPTTVKPVLWETNLFCETSYERPTSCETTLVRDQPLPSSLLWEVNLSCETTLLRYQSLVRQLLWETNLSCETILVRYQPLLWDHSYEKPASCEIPLLWDQFTKSQPFLILVIHAVNVYKLPWELLTILNRPHFVGRRDKDLWHLPLCYACISYI